MCYPAADEVNEVEKQNLYPGWSLQCLPEIIEIPLAARPTCEDVDESFCGADVL